jgi:DNA-binding response OmpR family regulator
MRGARVFIVEDEPLIAMMLEDMLTDLGCVVVDTASGLDVAMRKASTLGFDFCLLDINLSGQLSTPVVEVLRGRGLPFIVSTGLGQGGMPMGLGAASILSKPFSLTSLTAAVTRLNLPSKDGDGGNPLAG